VVVVKFLHAGWERAKPVPTHAPHLADYGWSGAEWRGGIDVLGVGLGCCCVAWAMS
jgi:hypothetical protein